MEIEGGGGRNGRGEGTNRVRKNRSRAAEATGGLLEEKYEKGRARYNECDVGNVRLNRGMEL